MGISEALQGISMYFRGCQGAQGGFTSSQISFRGIQEDLRGVPIRRLERASRLSNNLLGGFKGVLQAIHLVLKL